MQMHEAEAHIKGKTPYATKYFSTLRSRNQSPRYSSTLAGQASIVPANYTCDKQARINVLHVAHVHTENTVPHQQVTVSANQEVAGARRHAIPSTTLYPPPKKKSHGWLQRKIRAFTCSSSASFQNSSAPWLTASGSDLNADGAATKDAAGAGAGPEVKDGNPSMSPCEAPGVATAWVADVPGAGPAGVDFPLSTKLELTFPDAAAGAGAGRGVTVDAAAPKLKPPVL